MSCIVISGGTGGILGFHLGGGASGLKGFAYGIGIGIIIGVILIPNAQAIIRWCKKMANEIKK